MQHPPQDHSLLDMGCGTGVLAILAEKLGANSIHAIDVEPWCYQNTVENIATNACQNITQQKVTAIKFRKKSSIHNGQHQHECFVARYSALC